MPRLHRRRRCRVPAPGARTRRNEEFGHGQEELQDHIDTTPMIDCVFQLLIFFMVTATYTPSKLR